MNFDIIHEYVLTSVKGFRHRFISSPHERRGQ